LLSEQIVRKCPLKIFQNSSALNTV
jgi:hypothetical protein